MRQQSFLKRSLKTLIHSAALVVLGATATGAQAIDRGFIAPHEYALPTDFKPFNIFAQYAFLQQNDTVYDANGNKAQGPGSELLVGLSKYVRLWTPESNKNIGLAWEVIVPEIGIRDKNTSFSTGGFGDPITGFAIWTKPSSQWVLGADMFVSVPVGDEAVGGGDRWDLLGSIFWDAQYGKFNYTGNLGYHFNGSSARGTAPGDYYHLNNRFGYRVSDLIEPYVGIDYQTTDGVAGAPDSNETALAAGMMFHMYDHASIALHYQKGIDGESVAQSDSLNLRFVYVF